MKLYLHYCKTCMQMTNHGLDSDGKLRCFKHNYMEENKMEEWIPDMAEGAIEATDAIVSGYGAVKSEEQTQNNSNKKPEEKKGFFKKLWHKTIFPDMIAEKKKEKAIRREIQRQAKEEAMEEMKDILKEKYKQQEIKKMTGEHKKEKMQKFADAFSMGGSGGLNSEDKISRMLGTGGELNASGKVTAILGNEKVEHEPEYIYVKTRAKPKKKKVVARKVAEPENKDYVDRLVGNMGSFTNVSGTSSTEKKKKSQGDEMEDRLKRMLG